MPISAQQPQDVIGQTQARNAQGPTSDAQRVPTAGDEQAFAPGGGSAVCNAFCQPLVGAGCLDGVDALQGMMVDCRASCVAWTQAVAAGNRCLEVLEDYLGCLADRTGTCVERISGCTEELPERALAECGAENANVEID